MTEQESTATGDQGGLDQQADRRRKLARFRDEFNVDPYGRRTEGLISLADARSSYISDADDAFKADANDDQRPKVRVAGRVLLHRAMGNLIFITIRDHSGDLQIAVSKKSVEKTCFDLAKNVDLGDIAVAYGRLGTTKTGEITVWADGADGFELACKSLTPPPDKFHGLQDAELRYRKRYADMFASPEVIRTFQSRSKIVQRVRQFLENRGFLEVETPMMQPVAGGAAARPFTTHHNALDLDLFLRIAPELYLKRLLVGGLPKVYEINRNFRNEGIDRNHNPEFTMLELYEAFADYNVMMQITEQLINTLARELFGSEKLPFGDLEINYALPFRRATYHDLFIEQNGFDPRDEGGLDKLADLARKHGIEPKGKNADLLLSEVWEVTVEDAGVLLQPTFVIDYPASLCPLTRQKPGNPAIAERFELYIAGMELANAYTELNDPDVQEANFSQQLDGTDDEENTFRSMDHDFIDALKFGMPPAGGLGVGIDRLVMLLTNSRSIRDVILFPLMRPTQAQAADAAAESEALTQD